MKQKNPNIENCIFEFQRSDFSFDAKSKTIKTEEKRLVRFVSVTFIIYHKIVTLRDDPFFHRSEYLEYYIEDLARKHTEIHTRNTQQNIDNEDLNFSYLSFSFYSFFFFYLSNPLLPCMF